MLDSLALHHMAFYCLLGWKANMRLFIITNLAPFRSGMSATLEFFIWYGEYKVYARSEQEKESSNAEHAGVFWFAYCSPRTEIIVETRWFQKEGFRFRGTGYFQATPFWVDD